MIGWNSWNHFACNINEKLIKQTADIIVATGLAAAGYQYGSTSPIRPVHLTRSSLDLVNLDDCWQVTRDAQGIIQADSTAFPSGIPALADYIHSRKLKFGLYSGIPFPFFPARLYLHLKHRCWLQDLRRPTRLARLRTERRQHLCFVDSRLSQVRQLQHRRVDPRSAISGDARCSERQWSLHILLYVWYVLALPSLCSDQS